MVQICLMNMGCNLRNVKRKQAAPSHSRSPRGPSQGSPRGSIDGIYDSNRVYVGVHVCPISMFQYDESRVPIPTLKPAKHPGGASRGRRSLPTPAQPPPSLPVPPTFSPVRVA